LGDTLGVRALLRGSLACSSGLAIAGRGGWASRLVLLDKSFERDFLLVVILIIGAIVSKNVINIFTVVFLIIVFSLELIFVIFIIV
jgi:hypothetical protein